MMQKTQREMEELIFISSWNPWDFEYEIPPMRAIYTYRINAPTLDSAIEAFRHDKPTARIRKINGRRVGDDGVVVRNTNAR